MIYALVQFSLLNVTLTVVVAEVVDEEIVVPVARLDDELVADN